MGRIRKGELLPVVERLSVSSGQSGQEVEDDDTTLVEFSELGEEGPTALRPEKPAKSKDRFRAFKRISRTILVR